MRFSQILKELKEKSNNTLQEIANKNYLSKQTVSNYINEKRFCSFDEGISIIKSLGYNIKITEMTENMHRRELNNVTLDGLLSEIDMSLNLQRMSEYHKYLDCIKECSKLGLEIEEIDNRLLFKNTNPLLYAKGDILRLKKYSIELTIFVKEYVGLTIFTFDKFINDLMNIDEDIAKEIKKIIIYYCRRTFVSGLYLFRYFYYKNERNIVDAMPLMKPYIKYIMPLLCENDYFELINYDFNVFDIDMGYNLMMYNIDSNRKFDIKYTAEDGKTYVLNKDFDIIDDYWDISDYSLNYLTDVINLSIKCIDKIKEKDKYIYSYFEEDNDDIECVNFNVDKEKCSIPKLHLNL